MKKYLTDEFLDTTSFHKNQYPLLREFLQNEKVLKEYTREDMKQALVADNQELINIYDIYYYEKYLQKENDNMKFADIPNGSFNHNNFGMYKTKDGEYLVEIQF